jgi:hypothetical protein
MEQASKIKRAIARARDKHLGSDQLRGDGNGGRRSLAPLPDRDRETAYTTASPGYGNNMGSLERNSTIESYGPAGKRRPVSELDDTSVELDPKQQPPRPNQPNGKSSLIPGMSSVSSWLTSGSKVPDDIQELDSNPEDPSVGFHELESTTQDTGTKGKTREETKPGYRRPGELDRQPGTSGRSIRPPTRDGPQSAERRRSERARRRGFEKRTSTADSKRKVWSELLSYYWSRTASK